MKKMSGTGVWQPLMPHYVSQPVSAPWTMLAVYQAQQPTHPPTRADPPPPPQGVPAVFPKPKKNRINPPAHPQTQTPPPPARYGISRPLSNILAHTRLSS